MKLYKVERIVWNNVEKHNEEETTFVVAEGVQMVMDEFDDPYTQEIVAIETVSSNVRVSEEI